MNVLSCRVDARPVFSRGGISRFGLAVTEAEDNDNVPNVLYVRWPFVIGAVAVAVGLAATPNLVQGHWLTAAISGSGFGLVLGSALRFRNLTVTPDGLARVRGFKYSWSAAWVDVRSVKARNRHLAFLDQLRLHTRPVIDGTGTRKTTLRSGRRGVESDRRVFIAMYDRHWETGPIGIALNTGGTSANAASV